MRDFILDNWNLVMDHEKNPLSAYSSTLASTAYDYASACMDVV